MAETQTKPEAENKRPAKTARYVVVSDAVVVTIGKKNNGRADYTRVARGGVVNGNPDSEQIKDLLHKGALKRVNNADELAEVQADLRDPARSRFRQTVRRAARAMGAPDDPVQAPVSDVLPVPAPTPVTNPDAILAGDSEE